MHADSVQLKALTERLPHPEIVVDQVDNPLHSGCGVGFGNQKLLEFRTIARVVCEILPTARKLHEESNYGESCVEQSTVSMKDLDNLKTTVGFTEEDEQNLRLAGDVLADQTKKLVEHWRSGIIAGIPNLAKHSRTPEGEAIPDYAEKSGLRFQQWILDTCFRPYDQDWINYQQEIALRHTAVKKNKVDQVNSTPYVPLRDVLGFIVVMNETIKPYLAAKGHSPDQVERMHRSWCKSMQLQAALLARPYATTTQAPDEW